MCIGIYIFSYGCGCLFRINFWKHWITGSNVKAQLIFWHYQTVFTLQSHSLTWSSQRMRSLYSLKLYTKVKWKGIKDLAIRVETIKLLEGNMSRTHFDINHNNIFLDLSPKAREIKAKINKWVVIKVKSFCTAKETINIMKSQPIIWDKIFANDVSNKGLISNIYKQLI